MFLNKRFPLFPTYEVYITIEVIFFQEKKSNFYKKKEKEKVVITITFSYEIFIVLFFAFLK
ncbi:MAG TPA: hypothetical protein DEF61_04955 [Firmicutes bacterium]|nr:hypothetical protein [Bacillota bacterium]HBM70904.1 hypothetical protein [Bacillota bacterium]HBX25576.1 hypothetical protein [Bacillota bacterium]